MRSALVGIAAALLLSACGERTVARRIDALRGRGVRLVHQMAPAPRRTAELYGDRDPELERMAEEHDRRVRADEDARAILDAGPAAVSELVPLLDDPLRGAYAIFFLGEIGGREAAEALLRRWRALRTDAVTKHLYHRTEGGDLWAGGYRHDGVDQELYGELLQALRWAGLPVSAEIAADVAAAMDEGERLQTSGEDLSRREEGESDGRWTRMSWRAEPVECAEEGLGILAMVGAPEALALLERALRSPVPSFRWAAVQNASFLGDDAKRLVPRLGELLDEDPRLCAETIDALGVILNASHADVRNLPEAELAAEAERFREKLRDLGYLPRQADRR